MRHINNRFDIDGVKVIAYFQSSGCGSVDYMTNIDGAEIRVKRNTGETNLYINCRRPRDQGEIRIKAVEALEQQMRDEFEAWLIKHPEMREYANPA